MKVLVMAPPLRRGRADAGRALAALTVQALRNFGGHEVMVWEQSWLLEGRFDVAQICIGADLGSASSQVMAAVGAGLPVVAAIPGLAAPLACHEAEVIWSLAASADEACFASQGDRITLSAICSDPTAVVEEPPAAAPLPRPTGADFASAHGLSRFVLLDPPSQQVADAAARLGLACVSLSAEPAGEPIAGVAYLGSLSPHEAADAYACAAAFIIGPGLGSLRRAVEAAYCECPIVCPDSALAREVLGDGAHFYSPGDTSGKAIGQALSEAIHAPRGHVVRARVLAARAEMHPVLRLGEIYDRAVAACREKEKRSLRLARALQMHSAAWQHTARYWAEKHAEAAGQAADLHRRLTRLARLPIIRQALALKRLLGK